MDHHVKLDHVTISQAARHLGVSRQRVWQFVESGRLPITRLSESVTLVSLADLSAFSRRPRENGLKIGKSARKKILEKSRNRA